MRPMAVGVIAGGGNPIASLNRVKELGLECCQLSVPAAEWFAGEKLEQLKSTSQALGVEIVGFFCGFAGESYADIPTIQRTVGLVPPATRQERLDVVLRNSDNVARLGVPAILAHIGFVPEHKDDPNYQGMVDVVRQICERCASNGQDFGLETGQETAPALKQFIEDVGSSHLKVNFDPANMLLYGSGRPLEAVALLRDYLISIHCKDGRWPTQPGQLGEEVPFGEGEVNVPAFIGYLKQTNFTGPLVIEREISGEEQGRDIIRARDLIESLR